MEQHSHFGMLGLALLGLGGLFVIGADAFLGQTPEGTVSGFGLYAIAFALGAWSSLTVIFVVNYFALRFWNEEAIELAPR